MCFFFTGGRYVKVWDVLKGGQLLVSLKNHHKTVTCLCLNSSGQRLLSGSLDRWVYFVPSLCLHSLGLFFFERNYYFTSVLTMYVVFGLYLRVCFGTKVPTVKLSLLLHGPWSKCALKCSFQLKLYYDPT